MAYKALYRTYRPQTFEEVAGQKHIVKTLQNALATNKIAHAYLFCGPRGTGKTTMAKLFAKALNCEEGVGHQCNKCSNCIEITEGSHPDVVEIDAASNNGIEQVRDLIDKVNYLPIKGRYKVYIIDEVHMMTTNAFNALLKTLEEPPAHVIFILATTEPHNILPTIVSRCQRYDFTKVADADIAERMIEILEKENITYERGAVDAIISLADGGVRDALSILDQILAYSGNELKEDDVYELFGLASLEEKIDFIKAINDGNVNKCLSMIGAFAQGGIDLSRLDSDLLEILKDVLILKKTKDESQLSVLSEAQADDLASVMDIGTINAMINTFLKAQIDFKSVGNIQTLFEVVVLRLCTLDDVAEKPIERKSNAQQPAPQVIKAPKVEIQEKKVEPVIKEEVNQVQSENKAADEIKEQKQAVEEVAPIAKTKIEEKKEEVAPSWLLDSDSEAKPQTVEAEGEQFELDDDTFIKLMVLGDKNARKDLIARWNELDAYLGHPKLGDIIALLKDGKPFIVTKDVLILEFDFDKLANRTNVKSNQENLSFIMSKMVGHDLFVYGISRSQGVQLIKSYHALRQISKLPKANEVNIDVKEFK